MEFRSFVCEQFHELTVGSVSGECVCLGGEGGGERVCGECVGSVHVGSVCGKCMWECVCGECVGSECV